MRSWRDMVTTLCALAPPQLGTVAVALCAALLTAPSWGQAFDLVTPAEAAQSEAAGVAQPPRTRSVRPDAPRIDVIAPGDTSKLLRAPLRIELEFQAAGGARIVPSTFRVLYGMLRIDLTDRLRRHATLSTSGVVVEQAMVPPGEHRLFLQVADDRGAASERELQIRVATAGAADAAPAPRIAPLMAMVLQSVAGEVARQALTGEPSGLFKRLRDRLGFTSADSDGAPGRPDALVPTLGYAMDRLDPQTFASLGPLPVGGGEPPTLRTGEVFVLQFSTNLPGHVRLENIDPSGKVAHLGTYPVLADQLNRIPRDLGIRLEGEPGLERLRFYFQPCLHAPPLSRPSDGALVGRLAPCSAGAPRQLAAAAQGQLTARALVNLEQPDATMAFAGTTEFRPEDVTVMEATIRHVARP